MKKIGVIIPTFSIEYAYDYLCGVYDYFKDKDVKAIIAQTKMPHSTVCIYEYQYWSCMDFIASKEIDTIIIASGVYCASMKQNELEEVVKRFEGKTLVSAAIELKGSDCYTIKADCRKSFYDVISHLKNEHNCKKIAFMSANSTMSIEALDRYEAYKQALEACNLEYDSSLVFDGYFTDFGAKDALNNVIKSKEDIKFDAIVCANDMMAIGCYDVLKKLGVSIPDDVKIVGFDDSQIASYSYPKLSTINQNIYKQGWDCAEYAYRISNGEVFDRVIYTELKPKFRHSCGCIDLHNLEHIYKDNDLNVCLEDDAKNDLLHQYINDLGEKNNIITLMDMLKGSNTLRQFYYNLKYITGQIYMTEMSINLYKEPVYLDSNEDFVMPKEMELYMMADHDNDKTIFKPEIFFNPAEKIFADTEYFDEPGVYILYPIFSGESNYGYLTGRINRTKFADYNVYLKIIVTSIAQAFEYTGKLVEAEKLENENTKLLKSNTNLTIQSKTDELTGIFNRRGFYEYGQRTLDLIQEMNNAGIVFFADMDGLKVINDTYGHEMGDLAIKLQAQILKKAFRTSDIVGRISGDEFGIVAPGMIREQVGSIRKKIDTLCKSVSAKNKLPFTLSISLGYVDLAASTLLKKLMTEADRVLYEEKHKKHERK